jgi:mRNA interferase RelE/StbE
MYEIQFTDQARQDISNLPKFIKRMVQEAVDSMIVDPKSEGIELCRDLKGLWSWHVGDYRIVYEIEQRVIVYSVGHRKDIYLSRFLQDQAQNIRKRLP